MSRPGPGLAPDALAAANRLAASRERLRQALHDPAAAAQHRASGGGWLAYLASVPGAAMLLDGLRLWWGRHPWRVYGVLAADAARLLVRPVAQKHPVALVLAAGVLGAALRWVRPWRWIWRSGAATALLAGLLPQLLSHGLNAKAARRNDPYRPDQRFEADGPTEARRPDPSHPSVPFHPPAARDSVPFRSAVPSTL